MRRVTALGNRANPPAGPQGSVTPLSKLAGGLLVLSGLVGIVFVPPAGLMLVFLVRSASELLELVFFGIGILVIAIVVFAGGIGILRAAEWGRVIGIGSSVLLGAVSLATAIVSPDGIVFLLPFGLYASSAIVLIARWRGPAPTKAN
jgi:hypothetical protein